MKCCLSSARIGKWRRLLNAADIRRSFHAIPGIELPSQILLILLAGCVPAAAQSPASLTLQGVMPVVQRLNISPIQTTTAADHIIVALDANNNAATGYAVTIQSKAPSPQTNDGQTVYQLKCAGRSLTLAPGTSRLLAGCTDGKSARTILQISNPSALREDTLTLTVVSQ